MSRKDWCAPTRRKASRARLPCAKSRWPRRSSPARSATYAPRGKTSAPQDPQDRGDAPGDGRGPRRGKEEADAFALDPVGAGGVAEPELREERPDEANTTSTIPAVMSHFDIA